MKTLCKFIAEMSSELNIQTIHVLYKTQVLTSKKNLPIIIIII